MKVSVIIPVYNHASELEACLESLKRQTLRDVEVIVVDDGSDVPVVIPAKAGIQFIRNEHNLGAPAARNAGFDKSKGEYVIFLDADAELVPDALDVMVNELDAHPESAFVYSAFYWGHKLFASRTFNEVELRKQNYIHTSALIRRDTFPRFDESIKKFQDWDLFLMMVEQGHRGRFIERPLFTIKPRQNGGMSQWLPAFVYHLPWSVMGFTPKIIQKYREAEMVIIRKHGLEKQKEVFPVVAYVLGIIVAVELISYATIWYPTASMTASVLLGLLVLFITYKKPEFGLAAVLLEHLIGSLGHLFWNIRIVLVVAFLLGWLGGLYDRREIPDWRSWLKGREAWFALGGLIVYGILLGLVLQNPFVYADANAWGVLLLLPAILHLSQTRSKLWDDLTPVIKAGLIWLALESLFLFWYFSHSGGNALESPIYLWVRRTGVGEITQIKTGLDAYRIFLQSQIYAVLAAVYLAGQRFGYRQILAFAACSAVILVSFSRSFWIGTATGIFISFLFVLRRKTGMIRHTALLLAATMLGVFGVVFLSNWSALADLVTARASVSDAAASSRWELLAAMEQKIKQSPLLGYGFGSTVTFTSRDPRIVQKTGGLTTTYAFEWGWLDLWLKLGILGIPVMLWLLYSISRRSGFQYLPMIVALAAVHFFTPYLNHPLGLIVLMLLDAKTNKPPTS